MKVKSLGKNKVALTQINNKKLEMYNKAKRFGMTHPAVVACSQELDAMLNRYQGIQRYNQVI